MMCFLTLLFFAGSSYMKPSCLQSKLKMYSIIIQLWPSPCEGYFEASWLLVENGGMTHYSSTCLLPNDIRGSFRVSLALLLRNCQEPPDLSTLNLCFLFHSFMPRKQKGVSFGGVWLGTSGICMEAVECYEEGHLRHSLHS